MKFNQIYIEITKDCNLKCPFCPSAFVRNQHMSLSDIEKVIQNTDKYTDTYYLHVLGETLFYPDIDQLLSIFDQYYKKVKITTNGLLLSRYTNVLLSHPSVKQVNISVQSWIQFTKRQQLSLTDDLIKFIKKNDQKITVVVRFWNDKNNDMVKELNKNVYDELIKNLNLVEDEESFSYNGGQNKIRLKPYLFISSDDEFIWPSLNLEVNNNANYCLGGKKQLAILNNGDVVLCCLDYTGKTKTGNIFENDLTTILNSEPYLDFIRLIKNHKSYFELCQKCDYRNRFN